MKESRGKYSGGIAVAVGLFVLSACGQGNPTQKAVDELVSGETIRRLNEINQKWRATDYVPGSDRFEVVTPQAPSMGVKTPSECRSLIPFDPAASTRQKQAALVSLLFCTHDLLEPADDVTRLAFQHFQFFKLPEGQKALSRLSLKELAEYLGGHQPDNSLLSRMRQDLSQLARARYEDSELDELHALSVQRQKALKEASARVVDYLKQNRATLEAFAHLDRVKALLRALDVTEPDRLWFETVAGMPEVQKNFSLPTPYTIADISAHTGYLLWGALLPATPDEIFTPIDFQKRHPLFSLVEEYLDRFVLGNTVFASAVADYKKARDSDNPELPVHPAAASDAVRVAFMDSGVDFQTFPELGMFMGQGKSGEISSIDATDHDSNAWLPGDSGGLFGHGTGTMASLLTLVGSLSKETLEQRKVDVAMWKVQSLRQILAGQQNSGNHEGRGTWRGVFAGTWDAMVSAMDAPVKPRIVSLSMSFMMQPLLRSIKDDQFFQNTPWLWVMSAGNSGLSLDSNKLPSCMLDVPAQNRPLSRILCVGALRRASQSLSGFDEVASYSNYGSPVDIYAYESYDKRCVGGTSCSTPAISAAATLILAKYPALTEEQVRQVLLESAVTKKLMKRELNSTGGIEIQVRVFDPETMMDQAYAKAAKILGLAAPQ